MRDCRPLRTASFKLRKSGFLIKKEITIESESVDNDNDDDHDDDHDHIGVLISGVCIGCLRIR